MTVPYPALRALQSICCKRQRCVLECIELGDVNIHKPYRRILKSRLRSSREVAQPSSNGDDQIRIRGQPVGGRSAGDPYRPRQLRMIRME